jgi:diguanylate cyclase (GGDEF)-like protein
MSRGLSGEEERAARLARLAQTGATGEAARYGAARAEAGAPVASLVREFALARRLVANDERAQERVDALLAQSIEGYLDARTRALAELARRDVLTGLLNRAAFIEALNAEVARAHRYGRALALVLLDVDHFKAINDRGGHAAGDLALQTVARVLVDSLRRHDLVFRYGGDEFAALCPETTAVRLNDALSRFTSNLRRADSALGLSWGVASYPEDGAEPDLIVKAADRRLYAAKDAARS